MGNNSSTCSPIEVQDDENSVFPQLSQPNNNNATTFLHAQQQQLRTVAKKLAAHPIAKVRSNCTVEQLGTVSGFFKAYWSPEVLQRYGIKEGDSLQVKLLVVHTGIWRWLPSRINRCVQYSVQTRFGLMHTGLQIGPYILDWNRSSLITPRQLKSTHPLLFADLDTRTTLCVTMDTLIRICERVVQWNTNKYWSRLHNNCQVFVDDLLQHLQLQPTTSSSSSSSNSSTPFAAFLEELHRKGTGSMSYRNTITKKNHKVVFTSHKQLDKYVKKMQEVLQKNGQDLQRDYPEHYRLLKAFDRAFWLMINNKQVKQRHCLPWTHNRHVQCPFHVPNRFTVHVPENEQSDNITFEAKTIIEMN